MSQSGYLTGNLSQPALAGGNGYGHRIADTPKLKPKVSTTTIHSQPFYQLTVNPSPGMNEAQLGKLVMDKLKESERANQAQGRANYGDRS